MNYENMSDFDVNKMVAASVGVDISEDQYEWYGDRDENVVIINRYGKSDVVNYCNNPSDAWPIIMENKIAVMPWSHQEWQAFIMKGGQPDLRVIVNNPLRATMIVFLMIQEAKRG